MHSYYIVSVLINISVKPEVFSIIVSVDQSICDSHQPIACAIFSIPPEPAQISELPQPILELPPPYKMFHNIT